MTHEQQQKHIDSFTEKMKKTIIGKGDDYANEDRLSNFKLAGSICGLSPEQNCLSLIATKVARLGVLLKGGKQPNNESISDSLLDLANYAVLLDQIVEDRGICKKITGMVPDDKHYCMASSNDGNINPNPKKAMTTDELLKVQKGINEDLNGLGDFLNDKLSNKWEVDILHSHKDHYKDQFEKKQKEGWEIAGQATIQTAQNGYDYYIIIPLKRKL